MFEPGKIYTTRSTCDHDCVIAVRIVKRTARTVTIIELLGNHEDKPARKKIYHDQNGQEYIMPWGQFSMAPIIRAEDRAR